MNLKIVPVKLHEPVPAKLFRNRRRFIERRPALFIRHFEKKQKG